MLLVLNTAGEVYFGQLVHGPRKLKPGAQGMHASQRRMPLASRIAVGRCRAVWCRSLQKKK